MESIKKAVLGSKKYLIYLICLSAVLFVFQLGSIPFYVCSIWMMIILAFDAKNMVKEYFKEHFWFSLFVTAMLLSCVVNREVTTTESLFRSFTLFYVYYTMFVGLRDTEEHKEVTLNVIKVVTIVFFVYSLINLVDFTFGFNWFAQDLEYSRLSGIYGNPNNFGMCVTLGLLGGFLFKNRAFQIGNALLQVGMLYISDCRSMLISLLIICGVGILNVLYRKLPKKLFYGVTAIGIVAAIGVVYVILIKRFIGTGALETAGMSGFQAILNKISAGRIRMWTQAFELWGKHPIFGVGPANQALMMIKEYGVDINNGQIFYSNHQFLIDILLSGGIVALIPFLIWFYSIIRKVAGNLGIFKVRENVIVLCIAFVSFMCGMFDVAVVFDLRIYTLLFWLCFGYLNKIANIDKQ